MGKNLWSVSATNLLCQEAEERLTDDLQLMPPGSQKPMPQAEKVKESAKKSQPTIDVIPVSRAKPRTFEAEPAIYMEEQLPTDKKQKRKMSKRKASLSGISKEVDTLARDKDPDGSPPEEEPVKRGPAKKDRAPRVPPQFGAKRSQNVPDYTKSDSTVTLYSRQVRPGLQSSREVMAERTTGSQTSAAPGKGQREALKKTDWFAIDSTEQYQTDYTQWKKSLHHLISLTSAPPDSSITGEEAASLTRTSSKGRGMMEEHMDSTGRSLAKSQRYSDGTSQQLKGRDYPDEVELPLGIHESLRKAALLLKEEQLASLWSDLEMKNNHMKTLKEVITGSPASGSLKLPTLLKLSDTNKQSALNQIFCQDDKRKTMHGKETSRDENETLEPLMIKGLLPPLDRSGFKAQGKSCVTQDARDMTWEKFQSVIPILAHLEPLYREGKKGWQSSLSWLRIQRKLQSPTSRMRADDTTLTKQPPALLSKEQEVTTASLGQRVLHRTLAGGPKVQSEVTFHHIVPLSWQNNFHTLCPEGGTYFGALELDWVTIQHPVYMQACLGQ
ncbi:uncharacterized protein [Ambystoma mexicanum]|uniref:uncharacterized protein n=1 Tax=Ambystoma mexicanum TaxID=8296 RepID=UPI0037E726A2